MKASARSKASEMKSDAAKLGCHVETGRSKLRTGSRTEDNQRIIIFNNWKRILIKKHKKKKKKEEKL